MKKIAVVILLNTCCMLGIQSFAKPGKLGYIKDTSTDNQLSSTEKKEGWKLLFDGKTLDGWGTYQNIPGSWTVTNGMMCSTKPATDQNPDIITKDTYENFELSIDWKLSPQGNSGIMYMVTEDYEASFLSGPEYQLIDDTGFPEKIEDWQKTGANYGMQAPAVNATKPAGEWNHTVILISKNYVEHWLNGQKVVEYELKSETWQQQKAASKWKDAKGYGATKKGHIALQASHSSVEKTGICFKNVKIKFL